MPEHPPEVLFLCVHNAGRSQIAAALLDHYANGRVVTRSAGTAPAEEVNATVIKAMAEIGIDLRATGATPKVLSDAAVQTSDVVITMGCGDACPYYPGTRYIDWPVDDPAGASIEQVRRIRDDIDARVRALLAELVGPI
jgi:protein-tyrosine-phosphatase